MCVYFHPADTVQFVRAWYYGVSPTNGNSGNSAIQSFLARHFCISQWKSVWEREISLCKFGCFQWPSCHNAMSIGPTRGSWTKQNQKFRVKTKSNFSLKLLQNMYPERKIVSTKCCWRPPSSNIFMVHWRSGRKGGICSENGKSLAQSHPDIRSETQQEDFEKHHKIKNT